MCYSAPPPQEVPAIWISLTTPTAVTPRPHRTALLGLLWVSSGVKKPAASCLSLLVTPLFLGSHRPAQGTQLPAGKAGGVCLWTEPHFGNRGATSSKNRSKKTWKALRKKINRYSFPILPCLAAEYFLSWEAMSSCPTTSGWECARATEAVAGLVDEIHSLHAALTQGSQWPSSWYVRFQEMDFQVLALQMHSYLRTGSPKSAPALDIMLLLFSQFSFYKCPSFIGEGRRHPLYDPKYQSTGVLLKCKNLQGTKWREVQKINTGIYKTSFKQGIITL